MEIHPTYATNITRDITYTILSKWDDRPSTDTYHIWLDDIMVYPVHVGSCWIMLVFGNSCFTLYSSCVIDPFFYPYVPQENVDEADEALYAVRPADFL